MKKGKKRIVIGAAAVLAAAGGIYVAGMPGSETAQPPQVTVITAEKGDVEETVDASGTVGSEEAKTYYSPVNAQLENVAFQQGDVVKRGTKLIEFDLEDLEKDNQKAELNLKSGDYDYQNTINKSDNAEKKQEEAKANVKTLEKHVEEKKNYVSSLKSQISAVTAQAQRDAAAQTAAQAAAQAQAAQQEAAAKAEVEAEKQREIQSQYSAALYTYQTETLPNYQQQLADLNTTYTQAQAACSQADTVYQMAFAVWQTEQSDANTQALNQAEAAKSQAEITKDQAKQAYEDLKSQPPRMPVLTDFSDTTDPVSWELSDGTDSGITDMPSYDSSTTADTTAASAAPDTSGLESALEKASEDLAELQSELASEKAIAEADSTSLTKEEKEKLKITNNLTELDAKSAKELVEEGKKGVTADFNGIISKTNVQQGSMVTQGMELFTLQNTDKVSVDILISKYDYSSVKEGQKAEITISDHVYEGTVSKMSHIAETNEKGTPVISATVSVDHPDEDIFLGVDAKVKIHAASAQDVVTLPVEVVNIGKEGSFCYVIEDGIVTRRNITTGISSDDYVEITEGLQEGEQVISDLGSYEEGMEVEGVPEQMGEDANE